MTLKDLQPNDQFVVEGDRGVLVVTRPVTYSAGSCSVPYRTRQGAEFTFVKPALTQCSKV